MNVEELSTRKLIEDCQFLKHDGWLCTLALEHGLTMFSNGCDVRWRLVEGKKIYDKIMEELNRRGIPVCP